MALSAECVMSGSLKRLVSLKEHVFLALTLSVCSSGLMGRAGWELNDDQIREKMGNARRSLSCFLFVFLNQGQSGVCLRDKRRAVLGSHTDERRRSEVSHLPHGGRRV